MNEQHLISQKLQKLELEIRDFHHLTLQQLEQRTGIPQSVWSNHLNKEDTRQRITQRLNEDIEIAHRAALYALTKEAQKGNIQAIKELNQLSGILNQQNAKQVVTHYIPRPTKQQAPTPQKQGEVTTQQKEEVTEHDLPQL